MKRNKLLTGAVSIVCAGAMLVAGAFAIQGNHNIVNQFFARTELPPIDPFKPIIVEKFDPKTGTKEVKVSNTGDTIFYARLNLWEFMQLGEDVPATKPAEGAAHAYEKHTPASGSLTGGTHGTTTTFHDYFKLVFGDNVITQEEFNAEVDANRAVTGKWIYSSSDGYAYWSDPIQPGDSTDLFLKKVDLSSAPAEYYYALDVRMQYVDKEDLWLWASTAARESGDQIAPVSKNVRDHFDGWVTADPEVIPTSLVRVTGLKASNLWNVGDTVAPTKVEIAPNPAHPANPGSAGDTPVYTEVPALSSFTQAQIDAGAKGYTVTPATIAAGTEYIAIIVPTPTGSIGWYLQLGSSTPSTTITLLDGTKLTKVSATDPTANARIYEREDGTFTYYRGDMANMANGGIIDPDDLLIIVKYVPATPADAVYLTDVDVEPDTIWFHRHSATGNQFVPVYPEGACYYEGFRWGVDGKLGGRDEYLSMISPLTCKIPDTQQML